MLTIVRLITESFLTQKDRFGFEKASQFLEELSGIFESVSENNLQRMLKRSGMRDYFPDGFTSIGCDVEQEEFKCKANHIHRNIQLFEHFYDPSIYVPRLSYSFQAANTMAKNYLEALPRDAVRLKEVVLQLQCAAAYKEETPDEKFGAKVITISQVFHTEESLRDKEIYNSALRKVPNQNPGLN